ncbi:hypothetical protein D3C78_1209770 [compost metagenome]
MGELELLGVALDGIDILQHQHQIVGMQLLVADQRHRHPAPEHHTVPVQVAFLLGEGGTLPPSQLFVVRDAEQPVFRVVDLGGGAQLQLLLTVAQHLLDGRVDPEDTALQIQLADADRGMGHHAVQEMVILRLGLHRLGGLLVHQRQLATGEGGQQAQQSHELVHAGHGPLEHDAAQPHGLALGILQRYTGIALDLPALQHGGMRE